MFNFEWFKMRKTTDMGMKVLVFENEARVVPATTNDILKWGDPDQSRNLDQWFFGSVVASYLQWDASADVLFMNGTNMSLRTVTDSHSVRINSRDYTQASGSSIGFQSKPAQTVTSTGSVIGGEISPRVNNDIDIANVIGLHVDAYLKGTATKTVSGDVRGLQVELVTDDAGTNTVSGDVTAIRVRAAFSASTLSGVMAPFRVEVAEAQTNSQNWDCLFQLTGNSAGVWNSDPATEVSGSIKGYIKVIVNGADRYIALYDTGPTD